MQFTPPLMHAHLLRRYKRFLADVRLHTGEQCTIHCPNTGAMTRCIVENSDCWFSVSDNPKRKYPFTWEIATTSTGHLAGIHSSKANYLVREAIDSGVIRELQGYTDIASEVRYGHENSRIDFLLTAPDKAECYVEVKSVTLGLDNGDGLFPDAVSARALKHLRELISMVEAGHRAVLLFCVQHTGIQQVSPADEIDPLYGETLRLAIASGVEVIAYRAEISPEAIVLSTAIAVVV